MFLFLFWGASAAQEQVVTGGKTWYQSELERQWDKIVADKVHQAAVDLGRKGGLAGGKARADILSSRQKTAIANMGAKARWR